MEQAESQVKKMATSDHSLKFTPVNLIQERKLHYSANQQNRSTHFDSKYNRKPENKCGIKSDGKHCYRCGGSFPRTGSCSAEGKTCNACGESNHFSNVCMKKTKKGSRPPTRKKKINHVQDFEELLSTDDEWTFAVRKSRDEHVRSTRGLPHINPLSPHD